jgi:tight adherence protein B
VTLLLPFIVGLATFASVAFAFDRRGAAAAGRRVTAYLTPRHVTEPKPAEQVLLRHFERPLALSERHLAKLPGWRRFVFMVERADLPLRATEAFWVGAGAIGGVVLLALIAGAPPVVLIALAVFVAAGFRIWLGMRIERRRRAFEEQLPEVLGSLASALRAGHGFNQALQAVAADAAEPAAKEFTRVLAEARLGRPLEDALTDLGKRIDSRDLDFVLDAIIVQRQVGGSLAGIFAIVSESVRQRQQFALRLRSLTAMGRMSAIVLVGLPVGLGALLSLMQHAYFGPLVSTSIGHMMIGGSAFLMTTGWIWLRRIAATKGGS